MRFIGRITDLIKRGLLPRNAVSGHTEINMSDLHVAIIMDGNGRWATRQNLPRLAGHRAGSQSAKAIVEHAASLG
ncbi:MAG: undecaprenyl diphosphate synthase family protein, partial [Bacillota bacterium]